MKKKLFISCCLAMAMCVTGLGGCANGKPVRLPAGTTSPAVTTGPVVTTAPAVTEQDTLTAPTEEEALNIRDRGEPVDPAGFELQQLRLLGRPEGWWRAFGTGKDCFLVVSSAKELADRLTECGIDPRSLELSRYDDAFFADCVLTVIPRVSSSGSVNFSSCLNRAGDGVLITVEGKMPEIGTCDMADWLILVPVVRSALPKGAVIHVDPQGAPQGNSNLETR